MKDAPWNYDDDVPPVDEPTTISWRCPHLMCECHEVSEADLVEHRMHLYDEKAKRMPGARCRVLRNGVVINGDMPHADPHGVVHVKLHKEDRLEQLLVEWAPSAMPDDPLYPFRCHYFVNKDTDPQEATRRRLHNLGFSRFDTIADNVEDYCRAYRRTVTRHWELVAVELAGFHDLGEVPSLPNQGDDPHGFTELNDEPPAAAGPFAARSFAADGDGGGGGDADPPSPTLPKAPNAGSLLSAGKSELLIELRIETPLQTKPKRNDAHGQNIPAESIAFVANASLTLDGSLLEPPLPKQVFTTEADGTKRIRMPKAEGQLVIDIRPPKRWQNLREEAAGPGLTKELAQIADAALDKVSKKKRKQLYQQRHDAERRILEIEKEITELTLAKAPAATVTAKRAQLEAEHTKLRTARDAIKTASHQANEAYAKDVPEFMFRFFAVPLFLRKDGVLKMTSRRYHFGDPPFAVVKESPGKISVTWSPDWVRAAAFRFYWQQPLDASPFINPAKGYGGDKLVVIHATTTGSDVPLSTVVAGFSANLIIDEEHGAKRDDGGDTSIHYVVARNGHVVKLIDEHWGAFHAQPGIWERERLPNVRSVGIEVMNRGQISDPYTDAQILSLERLLGALIAELHVDKRRVVGHGEIERVAGAQNAMHLHSDRLLIDPGRGFPWTFFAERGLTIPRISGLPVDKRGGRATAAQIQAVKQKMLELGYTMSRDNRAAAHLDGTADVPFLRAYRIFQQRWHTRPQDKPKSDSVPDAVTADRIVAGITEILK